MQLLRNALDAIHSLTRVMNGEISDPRLANAEVRAAFGVLERAGFGPLSRSRKTSRAA